MEEKLIIRLSNNLGNQMFMYAAAYAASKMMNRTLYYDYISSYSSHKNIYKFALDGFNLSEKEAESKFLFNGVTGYFKRKILKKIDNIKKIKKFILEKSDKNKRTYYNQQFVNEKYASTAYMEGYFESEKYFIPYKEEIKKQFTPKKYFNFKNNKYLSNILNEDSVSLCVRQNRFTEKYNKVTKKDYVNSDKFVSDQLNFINKAIIYFKSKINNPIFYLWSNDIQSLKNKIKIDNVIFINNDNIKNEVERIHCDLFLMSKCKHFAVIPSAFNWWGCWLSDYKDSIIIRPNNQHFSNLDIKNKDYWPLKWKEI